MPICSRDDCAGNADQPWVDYLRDACGSTEVAFTFGRDRPPLPGAALGETSRGQSFARDPKSSGRVTKKECGRAPQQ